MLDEQVIHQIATNPPMSLLELYTRFCGAHVYGFGDHTDLLKQYITTEPTENDLYVSIAAQYVKFTLATAYVCPPGETSYVPKLAICAREYGALAFTLAQDLETIVLDKKLGVHLAEAMGYTDYVLITPAIKNVHWNSAVAELRVIPLVLPSATVYEEGRYNFCRASDNDEALATVYANPAGHMSAILSQTMNINPPAWFSHGLKWSSLALNTYLTDDQCWATLNDAINALQQQTIDTLVSTISGLAGRVDQGDAAAAALVEAVGSLAVFGNTVKDVATRYNAVKQYIPRP